MTFGSAWAMIRLLGVLRLDIPKLFGLLAARWKKRALRATLHRLTSGRSRLPVTC